MNNILVVEDEAIIAEDLAATLARLGYRVARTAQSGAEALQAVEEAPPDLILMDIKLKGALDGIDLTAIIKSRVDVPVIYLTSHSDEGTLARARETSPHGYLLKPFNERELRTALEIALRKHQLDAAMAQRERWFSTTLRSIGDAVIATDTADRVTFMNVVAEQLTGFTHAEAQGKKLTDIFRLVDRNGARLESPASVALSKGFRVELPPSSKLQPKIGGVLDVDDAAAPIVDERGTVLGAVVIFRDVTEKRKLEQRLARAERLASIGTMTAGLAHEINNPLSAMIANVAYAKDALQDLLALLDTTPDAARLARDTLEALVDAGKSGDRVHRLIRDLKKFSRSDVVDRETLDLPNVLDAAIALSESITRHSAAVVRNYGTTSYVSANEGQLVQVFVNLLTNAAQAIGVGHPERNRIVVITRTDERGRAVVEVSDSGPGIAPEHMPKLFDPFFTTKEVGAGDGLGLSICLGIVEGLNGELTAESTPGRGALFRVSLPAADGTLVAAPPVARAAPVKRARVLVIDDDDAVRAAISRVLGRDHDVVTEAGGRAALARLITGESFDVVFCDVMMPDMNGAEVHAALAAALPDVAKRVVFLSGGAVSEEARAFVAGVANLVVAKPFSAEQLHEIVAELSR